MNPALTDKVVLVTGASGGTGSAIARRFAEEGAKVVLHYRGNRAGAQPGARELKSADALVLRAELTREADVRRLVAQALKPFGRVDTLIANAGAGESRDVPLQA